jgi:O-antigen ligase/polysaccharide polymerase Wzy-like membrane protein
MVARSDGGWWPTTWGWAALALLFVAAASLILRSAVPFGRLDALFVGGLAAFVGWTGLSAAWSESEQLSLLELERAIVYGGGVLALLLVARRASVAAALGGLLTASVAVCAHALATRLVPGQVTWAHSSVDFRLAGVFGYPNALGITAVIGLLLALGFATDASVPLVRAAGAAAVVPLGLALYFTNSRGAWAALVVGVVATVGLAPRRAALLRVLAPLAGSAALAIWLASRSKPLTRWTDPLAAAHDGHRLAIAAALLTATAALTTLRARPLAAAAVVTGLLAVLVAPAGPTGAFAAGPGGGAPPGATPNERLFSTTTNSRTAYWRVAVGDFARHPVAGSGAGTFVREWYRHRRIRANVTDAHSLYLETLAELGLAGFALLAFVLALPLVAAARVRGAPFVAGALGAYVAFLAHAAVDWDWELPGVTLAGLFCGGLLVVAARPEGQALVLDRRWRTPVLGPVLALIAVSFVGLVGNRAQAAAVAAASRGDWQSVGSQARKAGDWAPWSADALVLQANAADHAGRHDDALALLRRAVGKDANDLGAWRALGSVASGRERAAAEARLRTLDPLG